jgi:hypothetical protein
VCEPSASAVRASGEVHGAKPPPSMSHRNVEPGLVDVNEKLGMLSFDGFGGCPVIVVSGGTALTVHVYVAGVGSALPATSTACTENVWVAFVSPVYVVGEPQGV